MSSPESKLTDMEYAFGRTQALTTLRVRLEIEVARTADAIKDASDDEMYHKECGKSDGLALAIACIDLMLS